MKANYEFTIYSLLQDKEGNVIKKDIKSKATYYIDDIIGVKDFISNYGNVLKDRCVILHNIDGNIVVRGKKKDIDNIIFKRYKIIQGYGKDV